MRAKLIVLVWTAIVATALAVPAALAAPTNSPNAVTNLETQCNGATVVVTVAGVPPAPMHAAAFGRPGIGWVSGSTTVQVPKQLRAFFMGELFDVISWGFGAQEQHDLTTCSFEIGPFTIEVDVMTTPLSG